MRQALKVAPPPMPCARRFHHRCCSKFRPQNHSHTAEESFHHAQTSSREKHWDTNPDPSCLLPCPVLLRFQKATHSQTADRALSISQAQLVLKAPRSRE